VRKIVKFQSMKMTLRMLLGLVATTRRIANCFYAEYLSVTKCPLSSRAVVSLPAISR